jgi:YHS domain-containing protein
MRKRYILVPAMLLCAAVAIHTAAQTSASSAPSATGKLTKVDDHKKVCMVTNKKSDKDMIPVEVAGKTYYGCCEMCKGTLTKDASQRSAVDPVTKKPVDKSQAVIGAAANGDVLYFENDGNLNKYNLGQ